MKRSGILILLIGLAAMKGCSDSARTQIETIDEEAIIKEITLVGDGFFEAWKYGDAAIIVSYLSRDFVNMPTIDITEDDFEAHKESTFDITESFTVKEIEYERIEIFIHADMAYEIGWLRDVLVDKESDEIMEGYSRILMVWKKVDDETWKLYRWLAQE